MFSWYCKQPGMEAIERLRFLASPPRGGREGEKTQPFNRFPSHRVSCCEAQLVSITSIRKQNIVTKWTPNNVDWLGPSHYAKFMSFCTAQW